MECMVWSKWYHCLCSGMEKARKEVAILLNDVWHSAVVDFRSVRPRILWIKFKFLRVKVCVVVGYSPNEGDG